MKTLRFNLLRTLTIIFCSSILFYSLNIYNGFITAKNSIFLIAIALFILGSKRLNTEFKFYKLNLLIALPLLYFTLSLFKEPTLIFNVNFQINICLCCLALISINLLKNHKDEEKKVIILLFIILLTLLFIGLFQKNNLFPTFNSYFKITGTFSNPGPYACLVSALTVIPVVLLSYKNKYKNSKTLQTEWFEYILIATLLLSTYILILTEIRTAVWSLVFVVIIIINQRIKIKHAYILSLVIGLIFIFGTFKLATSYKYDSTDGKLFIWKRTILSDSIFSITGNGINSFQQKYNLIQANYFEKNPDPNTQEAKLAGNVSYAYNEFIEIYYNYGLIGILFCLGSFLYIISLYLRNNLTYSIYTHVAFYLIVITFIQCLISYPLSMLGNKLYFSLALAIFIANQSFKPIDTSKLLKYFIQSIYLIIAISTLIFAIKNTFFHIEWNQSDFVFKKGNNVANALTRLKNLDLAFVDQSEFLVYYGKLLFLNNEIDKSIEILEKAKQFSSDPLIYYTLGQCYSAKNNNNKAVQNFNTAINVRPNLLYPRYLFLLHYINSNNSIEAKKTAVAILSINEKIKSTATMEIKDFATKYLQPN